VRRRALGVKVERPQHSEDDDLDAVGERRMLSQQKVKISRRLQEV
jgi:hypothetical protein